MTALLASSATCRTTSFNDPTLQGYVQKYTNFLYGYQERWFRLDHGNILYYLNKESVREGCRKYKLLTNFAIEEVDEEDDRRFDLVFTDERWCLKFTTHDQMLQWKAALRAFLPVPLSSAPLNSTVVPPAAQAGVDVAKLVHMGQNMESHFDYISQFLDKYISSQAEPVDLSTIEQTIDRCRQLETNLKTLRSMLRLHQVKESIMSEDEWHDADDGDIQLDKAMIEEIQKDLKPVSSVKPMTPVPSTDDLPNAVKENHHHHAHSQPESPIWKEIRHLTADQVRHAKAGVDEGVWEQFCSDGAMKMYKREMEAEDGLMVDPLKAVHSVEGVSAREYIHYFFGSEYKTEWDETLVKVSVVESLGENTVVLHQLHKKVWPAAQRESLFWSHLEDVTNQRDEDALDAFIVCNHNVERDDVPLTDSSCVRVGLTIAMMCQTIVHANARGKPVSELTRNDISVRIYYVAQVHPGGWVPTAALRQVYKREYPRFLRGFSKYVVDKIKDRPLTL